MNEEVVSPLLSALLNSASIETRLFERSYYFVAIRHDVQKRIAIMCEIVPFFTPDYLYTGSNCLV